MEVTGIKNTIVWGIVLKQGRIILKTFLKIKLQIKIRDIGESGK